MLRLKRLLRPARLMGRKFFLLPTLTEQEYVSFRGCLYTAATFTTRNYVAGDYLEFGVWEGDSFIKAYHACLENRQQHSEWLKRHATHHSEYGHSTPEFEVWRQWQPRFFAFDSFEGLPETSGNQTQEEWAKSAYQCSEERFKKNLAREGVDLKKVVTVPGFYDASLNRQTKEKHSLTRAAVVHIDCDLYESTMQALDFVTDLLVQGTVLIFDDWFFNQGRKNRGEQQACKEWLERNPQIELTPYWHEPQPMSFIVSINC